MHKKTAMALMICDITQALCAPEEFKRIQMGENPHDLFDANQAVYGAHCALYFAEMDAGNQEHADLANEAWEIADACKWNRDLILTYKA